MGTVSSEEYREMQDRIRDLEESLRLEEEKFDVEEVACCAAGDDLCRFAINKEK